MSTFKEIAGRNIRSYTTNPDNPLEGQMWYNQTDFALKGVVAGGAWSSAAPLGTARYAATGFGVQTASVASMGITVPNTPTTATEEYNGTGWSTGTNYPAGGSGGGTAGTQTAGLIAGGQSPRSSAANEYDGTSWTGTGALPGAADNISGCGTGTQTNVIMAIGRTPSSGNSGTNTSVTYNGSVFGSGPNLNTARMYGSQAGSGTGTAGLIFGGFIDPSPNAMTNTEEYDGSSWTNGGSLNVATGFANGFGTQTNTVTNVSTPANQGSEQYNGTSWSALPNIGVATPGGNYLVATGTSGNAGMISAMSPTLNQVAEWNFTANTITPGAWASGGALNTARAGLTGFGAQTAAIAANGDTYPPATGRYTNAAEEYNGATWTNIASTNTSTNFAGSSKLSPSGAGSVFGGEPVSARHEYWDGSSWSEQTDMNTPGYAVGGAGTQTSSLAMAGTGRGTNTESWDGSSWTNESAVPFVTFNTPGAGSQTAAIIFGGNGPSGVNTTAEYNSGTWTAGGNLIGPKTNQGGAGTQTAALSFMGATPTTAAPYSTTTEGYDGTAWSTRPSAATARRTLGSAGTQTAALGFGGYTPGKTTATEEFTGETTAVNIKTFTTS